ncbi:hypothetical protein JB92DRAFT_2863328 [Gautieria morchelliformis]|nr:hypothetical protein JB92DRAFT_2863328 [Gautieria morchelliformis]
MRAACGVTIPCITAGIEKMVGGWVGSAGSPGRVWRASCRRAVVTIRRGEARARELAVGGDLLL